MLEDATPEAVRQANYMLRYVQGLFFEGFSVPIRRILKIMLKYSVRQSVHSIARSLDISRRTLDKIIDSFRLSIPAPDFSEDKLGGPWKIV